MATPEWTVSGQYYETCSCDFLCPCVPGQLQVKPTQGSCTFAMAFQIERGHFGAVPLDGMGFALLGFTPEEMGKGNWTVGAIIDERASDAQREAISAIATGAAGGPVAAIAGLVGKVAGVESGPIAFERDGERWSVTVPGRLDIAGEGVKSLDPKASGPMYLDNTGHPAVDRFALARGVRSDLDALGLSWHHRGGGNNGQYAPFSWQGG